MPNPIPDLVPVIVVQRRGNIYTVETTVPPSGIWRRVGSISEHGRAEAAIRLGRQLQRTTGGVLATSFEMQQALNELALLRGR